MNKYEQSGENSNGEVNEPLFVYLNKTALDCSKLAPTCMLFVVCSAKVAVAVIVIVVIGVVVVVVVVLGVVVVVVVVVAIVVVLVVFCGNSGSFLGFYC